jgi:archaellum component FlaC
MSIHFNEFMSNYTKTSEMHQELLDNFENYLTSLSDVKLHPELVTEMKSTLLDCIPIEREKKWVVQCQRSHFYLKSQVDQLQSMYSIICNEIAETIGSQDNIDEIFLHAKESLEKINAAAEQQKSTCTKIRENYEIVVKRVSETSEQFSLEIGAGSNYMAGSTSALEACRSLDQLWREQCELV